MDTSLIEDKETNTIFMLYCHIPEGIGLWKSESGIGFTGDGKQKLYNVNGAEFNQGESGYVYDFEGNKTDYTVNDARCVFIKKNEGIYFLKKRLTQMSLYLKVNHRFSN